MSDRDAIEKVAFIGLGAMGLPMASHLVSAGFAVSGFDLSDDARARLAARGGKALSSIEAAVAGADVVVTMLPNGKVVHEAIASGAALEKLAPGTIVLEMSSSSPSDTQRLAADLAARAVTVVDAPVSGGTKKAIAGTLAIMVGGDAAAVERVRPLLDVMGEKVFPTGPVGSAHAMKAINNYVSGASVIATMEAVLLGEAFGLSGDTIVDILNASTGRSNTSEVKMRQFVLSKTYASGFALGLMAKDIGIAASLAQEMGVRLDGLDATARDWAAAAAELGAGADHTEIMKFVKQRARAER